MTLSGIQTQLSLNDPVVSGELVSNAANIFQGEALTVTTKDLNITNKLDSYQVSYEWKAGADKDSAENVQNEDDEGEESTRTGEQSITIKNSKDINYVSLTIKVTNTQTKEISVVKELELTNIKYKDTPDMPAFTISIADPKPYYFVGDSINLQINGDTASTEGVTYNYQWIVDGNKVGENSLTHELTLEEAKTYNIECEVSMMAGAVVLKTQKFTLPELEVHNQPEGSVTFDVEGKLSTSSSSQFKVLKGSDITIKPTVAWTEGKSSIKENSSYTTEYEWSYNDGSEKTSNDKDLSISNVAGLSDVKLTATLKDSEGNVIKTIEQPIEIQVIEASVQAPTIDGYSNPIESEQPITLTASATNNLADLGSGFSIKYEWTVNGVLKENEHSDSLIIDSVTEKTTVSVKASIIKDGQEDQPLATSSSTEIEIEIKSQTEEDEENKEDQENDNDIEQGGDSGQEGITPEESEDSALSTFSFFNKIKTLFKK